EVLMLEGYNRQVDPDHPPDSLGVASASVHDDLSSYVALLGRYKPFTGQVLLDFHNAVMAHDLRPKIPSGHGERIACTGWIDMAALRRVEPANHVVEV